MTDNPYKNNFDEPKANSSGTRGYFVSLEVLHTAFIVTSIFVLVFPAVQPAPEPIARLVHVIDSPYIRLIAGSVLIAYGTILTFFSVNTLYLRMKRP